MPYDMNDQARRVVTEQCLIAADVDRTILTYADSPFMEKQSFRDEIAPELFKAAKLGAQIAFITGNSMRELCSRILPWLIEDLCHRFQPGLLACFHFFSNCGGVYFRIADAAELAEKVGANPERILKSIVDRDPKGKPINEAKGDTKERVGCIKPRYVDGAYLEQCMMSRDDASAIKEIALRVAASYMGRLSKQRRQYEEQYDLDRFSKQGPFPEAAPDERMVWYEMGGLPKAASVQVTLKPVLSSEFAREGKRKECEGHDERTCVCRELQQEMDTAGLGHYTARSGGRTSIDITLDRLDKAYALEFLIDRLRLQGNTRRGRQVGSNAVYFGDEVLAGGGNDYPVTRIPGLLVFAVGREVQNVPFRSAVIVPSWFVAGPAATSKVLADLNRIAEELIDGFRPGQAEYRTAIDELKVRMFSKRIEEKLTQMKLDRLSAADQWQVMHALVTLVCREDFASRHWVALLVDELDAIMKHLWSFRESPPPIHMGMSHPDH